MRKLIRKKRVAVAISPGFGAGWSTWACGDKLSKGIAFDRDVCLAIESGDIDYAVKIAHDKYGDFYDGGARNLCIVWVDRGAQFQIHEYDGSESLQIISPATGWVA